MRTDYGTDFASLALGFFMGVFATLAIVLVIGLAAQWPAFTGFLDWLWTSPAEVGRRFGLMAMLALYTAALLAPLCLFPAYGTGVVRVVAFFLVALAPVVEMLGRMIGDALGLTSPAPVYESFPLTALVFLAVTLFLCSLLASRRPKASAADGIPLRPGLGGVRTFHDRNRGVTIFRVIIGHLVEGTVELVAEVTSDGRKTQLLGFALDNWRGPQPPLAVRRATGDVPVYPGQHNPNYGPFYPLREDQFKLLLAPDTRGLAINHAQLNLHDSHRRDIHDLYNRLPADAGGYGQWSASNGFAAGYGTSPFGHQGAYTGGGSYGPFGSYARPQG